MKHSHAAYFSAYKDGDSMAGVSEFLNQAEKQTIGNLLWSADGYKPDVSFAIAYTDSSILVKYFVAEKHVKADYHKINDPVFKDSCVEFFIMFDDNHYYNLEFNSIGTALIGYGSGKTDREYLDEAAIAKIRSHHAITHPGNDDGNIAWELTLNIPFTLFVHSNITSLKNKLCKVNFYKCGDDLPQPHFLSWNAIDYPYPNFHLPQFFGSVLFS